MTAVAAAALRRRDAAPVTPRRNALAMGGEYVSAAAFLGLAGLVLAYGAGTLWLPVAATAGYVLLLAFVAAPLRRCGAYTVADFAGWRLASPALRLLTAGCVCVAGWFCLLPQFRGAGLALRVLTGAPDGAGWAVLAAATLPPVLAGTVRGVTAVHAALFRVKLIAVAVPALALLGMWHMAGGAVPGGDVPRFEHTTRVHARAGVTVNVVEPVSVTATGPVDGAVHDGEAVLLPPGRHSIGPGADLVFPGGAAVPHAARLPAQDGATWREPFGRGGDHALFRATSVLLAVLLGTMGLPHILMRFHPNITGTDARRTAALMPVLLGVFFVFPVLCGALGRRYAPGPLVTGDLDAALLLLPGRAFPGPAGALLTGLVAAGAFAAFLAASRGLVAAIAGTVAQCARRGGGAAFRAGAVAAVGVPPLLLPLAGRHGVAALAGVALTVSACTLCPLLVLGIWWRGLTAAGAAAGLLTGGVLATGTALTHLAGASGTGWPAAILAQPALLLVPSVFAIMTAVSLLTRHRVPPHTPRALALLHLPDPADHPAPVPADGNTPARTACRWRRTRR